MQVCKECHQVIPEPAIFARCRVCKKRIPKARVDAAIARGKVPGSCGDKCSRAWKMRVNRANRKAKKNGPE